MASFYRSHQMSAGAAEAPGTAPAAPHGDDPGRDPRNGPSLQAPPNFYAPPPGYGHHPAHAHAQAHGQAHGHPQAQAQAQHRQQQQQQPQQQWGAYPSGVPGIPNGPQHSAYARGLPPSAAATGTPASADSNAAGLHGRHPLHPAGVSGVAAHSMEQHQYPPSSRSSAAEAQPQMHSQHSERTASSTMVAHGRQHASMHHASMSTHAPASHAMHHHPGLHPQSQSQATALPPSHHNPHYPPQHHHQHPQQQYHQHQHIQHGHQPQYHPDHVYAQQHQHYPQQHRGPYALPSHIPQAQAQAPDAARSAYHPQQPPPPHHPPTGSRYPGMYLQHQPAYGGVPGSVPRAPSPHVDGLARQSSAGGNASLESSKRQQPAQTSPAKSRKREVEVAPATDSTTTSSQSESKSHNGSPKKTKKKKKRPHEGDSPTSPAASASASTQSPAKVATQRASNQKGDDEKASRADPPPKQQAQTQTATTSKTSSADNDQSRASSSLPEKVHIANGNMMHGVPSMSHRSLSPHMPMRRAQAEQTYRRQQPEHYQRQQTRFQQQMLLYNQFRNANVNVYPVAASPHVHAAQDPNHPFGSRPHNSSNNNGVQANPVGIPSAPTPACITSGQQQMMGGNATSRSQTTSPALTASERQVGQGYGPGRPRSMSSIAAPSHVSSAMSTSTATSAPPHASAKKPHGGESEMNDTASILLSLGGLSKTDKSEASSPGRSPPSSFDTNAPPKVARDVSHDTHCVPGINTVPSTSSTVSEALTDPTIHNITPSSSTDSAPELTSEASSDTADTLPATVPDKYPTRLTLHQDEAKLNSLHCFLRAELLEVFVVQKSNNKSPTHSPGSSVGRVGLRCVHCALKRRQRDHGYEAPMAVFYPKSIGEIYRLVTSWQRCHLRKCRTLPPPVRSKWLALRENNKSRGKTHYWVTSAKDLGLVDCQSRAGGIRFRADLNASQPNKSGVAPSTNPPAAKPAP